MNPNRHIRNNLLNPDSMASWIKKRRTNRIILRELKFFHALENILSNKINESYISRGKYYKPKLTKSNIRQIYKLCSGTGINHYDVQIEIADHLASDIEEQWKVNPLLTFRKALQNAFIKFGADSFSIIYSQKEKELKKKYNRLMWDYYLDFFKWPKIAGAAAATIVLYLLLCNVRNLYWFSGASVLLMIVFLIWYMQKGLTRFRISTPDEKRFLLAEHALGRMSIANSGISMVNQIFLLLPIIFKNTYPIHRTPYFLILSIVVVCSILLIYTNSVYIPKRMKQHFSEQFPQYAN